MGKGISAMRIVMLGTRGVPARYGGFETCIEEVGSRLVAAGHEVTVYCRNTTGEDMPTSYRGMDLVTLPAVPHKVAETLSHSAISVGHVVARRRPDAALLFNAANAPFLPALRARRIPVATHVDGLEWKRAKWSGAGQKYYRAAESLAVRWSDALIADAQGIADYYRDEFGVPTELIRYGAPRVARGDGSELAELGLTSRGYHLVVARFEPENHVHLIVEGYVRSRSTLPLVVVGGAPYADAYTNQVKALADDRVRFLGPVWDQDLLDQLYAQAFTYWHGHSVGGTNPSLLRALGAGAPTNGLDVIFNREVLGSAGQFFTTAADVAALIDAGEADPQLTLRRSVLSEARADLYDWDDVAESYEQLCFGLAAGSHRRSGASGRRHGVPLRSNTVATPIPTPVLHGRRPGAPLDVTSDRSSDLADIASVTPIGAGRRAVAPAARESDADALPDLALTDADLAELTRVSDGAVRAG